MVIFGESTSQRKGCPKGVYLGLCEEGLVKGIPKGKYTKSKKIKGMPSGLWILFKTTPMMNIIKTNYGTMQSEKNFKSLIIRMTKLMWFWR